MIRTPFGRAAFRCAKCGTGDGLAWINGIELCVKCAREGDEGMIQNKVHLGPISSDTLKAEDLLEAFAWELNDLDKGNLLAAKAEALLWGDGEDFTEEEMDQVHELLEDIENALNELCPPFVYFGARYGDGACFGFWFDNDALAHALRDDELYERVVDEDDQAYRYLHDYNIWVFISDHGNVTIMENDAGKPGNEIIGVV
jgi:hypothetical protein